MAADPMLGFNTRTDSGIHKELGVLGECYPEKLRSVLRRGSELGLIGEIEASVDYVHVPHWGRSKAGEWGTPYSTMMNKPFPGLYPLSMYDLNSGLFLSFTEFVQRPPKETEETEAPPGEVTCREVMEAVRFLGGIGLKVRSVRGDRLIASESLMRELGGADGGDGVKQPEGDGETAKARKRYYFALKSNSVLRRQADQIPEDVWIDTGQNDLVAKHAVTYHGLETNLIVLRKESGRRYMFVSNDGRDPPTVLGEYRRRGLHEKAIGRLNKVGFKSLPSNDLDRIAGHLLLYVFLGLVLAMMRREFGLGNVDAFTLRLLLSKPGLVRHDQDGVRVWMVVNRALLKRLGRSTIRWSGGVIRLIELRQGHPRKNYGQSTN